MDPSIDFVAFMQQFDTVLMGRGTYEASKGMSGGGMPGMTAIVCSRTLEEAAAQGVQVVRDGVQAVAELRQKAGKDIWLFGGGNLFRSLLDAGAVDQIELSLIPVLLGSGIPLLPPGKRSPTLRLNEQSSLPNGTVVLTYSTR